MKEVKGMRNSSSGNIPMQRKKGLRSEEVHNSVVVTWTDHEGSVTSIDHPTGDHDTCPQCGIPGVRVGSRHDVWVFSCTITSCPIWLFEPVGGWTLDSIDTMGDI